MDGGARTFLSYRSCYTTQGDHLKWRSSFLNGLTNAHTKGHYRKVLYMKLGVGGKPPPNHTGPAVILFPLHCTARAGKKNYCCQGYWLGGVNNVWSQKHLATSGWPSHNHHVNPGGQTQTTAIFACGMESRGLGIQASISKISQKSISQFISALNQILEAVMGISMIFAQLRIVEQVGRTRFIIRKYLNHLTRFPWQCRCL